jgi:hypothetical protein
VRLLAALQGFDRGGHSEVELARRGLSPATWAADHPWLLLSLVIASELVALWCIVRLWKE